MGSAAFEDYGIQGGHIMWFKLTSRRRGTEWHQDLQTTEAQARTIPHSKGSRPSAQVPETRMLSIMAVKEAACAKSNFRDGQDYGKAISNVSRIGSSTK